MNNGPGRTVEATVTTGGSHEHIFRHGADVLLDAVEQAIEADPPDTS